MNAYISAATCSCPLTNSSYLARDKGPDRIRLQSCHFPRRPPTLGLYKRMSRKSSEVLSPRASFQPSHDGLGEPLLPRSGGEDGDGDQSGRAQLVAELGRLARLSGPLILQNLAGYMLSVISTAFIGHLNDPVALSATVLATSFYNITGYSLVIGLSAGMETMCGQAYGAGNYSMLGLVLQRALLICWAACVPIALFWTQAHRLMLALHQEPLIVAGACKYLAIATPAVFLASVSSCLYRYLVTQQEVRPPMICTLITAALCPAFNWLLIYKFQMGLEGAAWAFLASTATYTALLAGYTVAREVLATRADKPRRTWAGFSWQAWADWGTYLRFAAPSAAMICMEWWIFELVIFMAGSLKDFARIAVAVMGISFNITSWTYMIPMSLGTAANTRVANALGSGSAAAARTAARTAVSAALVLQLCLGGGLFAGQHLVARIFTSEPSIVYNVGRIMPALAASAVGDGMVAVLGGVLRGSGRQTWGAALNLVGYWAVGCPLALLLGFKLGLDVVGFWCGLAAATSLQAVILAVVVSRFDWDLEVRRAAKLVSQHAAADASTAAGEARPQPPLADGQA
ncbi:hypothetical protein PLESTB_001346900 [Pleodorina starrii]|uniref:Protein DETOXIFICATION n=1 Tax=Pleodorina starrii TaxID=330485 RepID=A0A9W6BVM1_9CHLO|nr:hypothetical protein PLESTM_001071400 [Pleodorina starrii]GLC58326.1 hypothetical protein PLESTB_001346900 [Pleodorina starrii]GLC66495.1 hypothetical protein PLESTF_000434000 [Pleodorina starrii]